MDYFPWKIIFMSSNKSFVKKTKKHSGLFLLNFFELYKPVTIWDKNVALLLPDSDAETRWPLRKQY